MRKNYILLIALISTGVYAQTSVQVIDNYLKKDVSKTARKTGGLSSAQYANVEYTVLNENEIGNVGEFVKIQQKINDIPVYASYGTFQIKDKKVQHFNDTFKGDIPRKTTPALDAIQSLEKFAANRGKKIVDQEDLEEFTHNHSGKNKVTTDILYSKKGQKLYYFQTAKGLKLAWNMLASFKEDNDSSSIPLYEILLDAETGELLSKTPVVNECFIDPQGSTRSVYYNKKEDYQWIYDEYNKPVNSNALASGSYRVVPANYQSPSQHNFTLVSNADDPIASREGWHKKLSVLRDTAAPPLTDFQTIGNNAHVSSDTSGIASDIIINSGGLFAELAPFYFKEEADGGPNLLFDFPNPGTSTNYNPLDYSKASTTQMFYSINSIHDILHYHGFNPKAGSFQANSGEGYHVTGITVAGLGQRKTYNNAFMVYSAGFMPKPTTCFFTFQTIIPDAGVMDITSGSSQGTYKGAIGNNTSYRYGFDPKVLGNYVLVNDGTGASTSDGCETPVNGSTFQDKIVIVDRGNCGFSVKVTNIKPFHPKGIVIANNSNVPLTGVLAVESTEVNQINTDLTFPIVTAELDIAAKLKQELANGTAPQLMLPSSNYAFTSRDSGFDSQVILHEYMHAVSGRLTDSKMNGEEGMNEGWSDYVALNLTQQASQIGSDLIDMGGYAFGGNGMRPKPYTTDMSKNPHTYDYLKEIGAGENKQHPTGYLWAVMLWEMHWKFVNKYGFNPDHKSNQGGNNMALDLVIQGQKMQVANPGFVEGRDAILQADELMFNGENKCIIWEAFAKRGLGVSATQGTSQSRVDGTQAFDLPAACNAALSTSEVKNSEVTIYPNPAKDVVYVMSKDEVVKAEIIDISGRLVSTQTVSASNQNRSIDTSKLQKGLYLVKLHTKSGIVTKKIIKN